MTHSKMGGAADVLTAANPLCPLCGRPGSPLYQGLTDRIFGIAGTWNIRRCREDKVLWLDPTPVRAELPKLYEGYYTHNAPSEPADLGSQRSGRLKRLLALLMPWRRHAFLTGLLHLEDLAPGRLLEIGCGSGSFLREAAGAGWQAEGVDFDEHAVAAANSIHGVTARAGDVLDLEFGKRRFDAIVLNNVLEHLPEPLRTLQRCRELLAGNGRLVAITPNSLSLGHRIYGADWRGLEVPRHLIVFSPKALSALAVDAGFSRVRTFTSSGGGAGIQILRTSAEMSGRNGLHAKAILNGEKILVLLGLHVGEWAVLIASE